MKLADLLGPKMDKNYKERKGSCCFGEREKMHQEIRKILTHFNKVNGIAVQRV